MTWKDVLEIFRRWPGKLTNEWSPVSPRQCSCTQVCGCNGFWAWLWLWTRWQSFIFWFGTIWLFSVPKHEKQQRLAGEAVSDRWWGHIRSWGFFWGSGWELLYHRNPIAATPMEEVYVWTAGETMLKNKPHLVKFDHCFIDKLWTIQPTLILWTWRFLQKVQPNLLRWMWTRSWATCTNCCKTVCDRHLYLYFLILLNRLNLEQRELCRCRTKLFGYLDRLKTYEVSIA